MAQYLLISDAAKEVEVESHVLRYWEEELHLPIKRNELGHRYYTQEDVERFKQVKSMKERGLQLKAIKMILKDGKLDVLSEESKGEETMAQSNMAIQIVDNREEQAAVNNTEAGNKTGMGGSVACESKEEKARRLQWMLKELIREALQENNQDLCREIKESVVKELDYQFRNQEEREEERNRRQEERNEEYYQKMDELLRKKGKKKRKPETGSEQEQQKITSILDKKKRHFLF